MKSIVYMVDDDGYKVLCNGRRVFLFSLSDRVMWRYEVIIRDEQREMNSRKMVFEK